MTLRITYDGKHVLTTAQAASRYGLTPSGMRATLTRLDVEPIPEALDGRTPLYLATELDKAMAARPGKGANLRGPRRRVA